jgi:glycosyltransferase involved in cell wall biosynthesis
MRLCWNAIVKNESGRILRACESVLPHITCYAICDTGSTDGTQDMIIDFFGIHGIPGTITSAPFEDFSQARNAGLEAARSIDGWDYALLMDADMELKVIDPTWADGLNGEAYDMYQTAGILSYQNRRLLSCFSKGTYLGVTHEYLDVPTYGCLSKDRVHFVDHADGTNRKDKFERDIRLFKKSLKTEPNNVRTFYYLAQSYKDAGKTAEAAKWYDRRIKAGGWAEEVWSAMERLAECYKDLGRAPDFIATALEAYNFRPTRAESLYHLAKFFREKGQNYLGVLFAEAGLSIPPTGDALFVNDYVYRCGLKEEFSICAYYVPEKRNKGFSITDELAIGKHTFPWARGLADINMVHYLQPLKDWCPSFDWRHVTFQAEEHWTAMNPSVTTHILPSGQPQLKVLVRTVNYRMDEQGRYLIRGLDDGTVTNSNPINTRNWLVPLTDDLDSICQIEVVPPPALPCGYPLVVGFEDMRLIARGHDLYTSSTVRQFDPDGIAEQVIARIGDPLYSGSSTLQLTDIYRMLRSPRLYEKNWAPFVHKGTSDIRFMYRPGHVVDDRGQDVVVNDTPFATGAFAGSSQLIWVDDYLLGIIHEARYHLGTPLRYYQHRFVLYGLDYQVAHVSKPFFFNDKVIEFSAGLALHPNNVDLIISYGWKDCEARLARVRKDEVMKFILTEGQHG